MLVIKHFPQQLVNFLRDGQMFKAGYLVNNDLRQLACNLSQNLFVGDLELGAFKKKYFLIFSSTISLADLTAQILDQCLSKNIAE